MSVFFEFSSWILLFSTDFNLTAKSYQNLSDARMYYKCEKGGTFSDEALTIKFKEFKVQAFNVENGDFSKNGMSYICLYTQYYFKDVWHSVKIFRLFMNIWSERLWCKQVLWDTCIFI